VVYPEKVAARTWVSERQDETTARETDLEQGPEQGRVSVAAPDHLADVAEGIGEAVGNISELGRSGSGLSAPKPPPVAPPPPVTNATTWGAGAENGVDAVLIGLSADCAKIEELGRVAMPGNPILGEGKPENQNIALTFTRGQRVMLIDMNQDAYFEEALKVRNLLQEFEPAHSTSPPVSSSDHRPITIVGFPENVFSSTSGFATAIYAAMQERYFGTFYQRVLASPLDVRMHYGHPDLVDKLHFMTRGGVAKASKEINLSEDVFAGYKTTLRGGRSVFKEYHQLGKGRGVNLAEVHGFFTKLSMGAAYQLQSRDVYRVCKLLPLERRMSLFLSAFGFYVSNAVTMYSVQMAAFLFALLAVSNLLTTYAGMLTSLIAVSTWIPFLVMIMMFIPDVTMVALEQGCGGGCKYFCGKIVTLSPLYYIFVAQSRAYGTVHTLRWGKGAYYATKRSVAITHQPLHELFQTYAKSHFNPAVDTATMLTIASLNAPGDWGVRVLIYWIIIIAIIVPPFLYNPLAFDWASIVADLHTWQAWVGKRGLDGKGKQTWRSWWEKTTPTAEAISSEAAMGALLTGIVYFYIGTSMMPMINPVVGQELYMGTHWWNRIRGTAGWQASLGIAIIFPFFALAALDTHIDWDGLPPLLAKYARYAAFVVPWLLSATWYCLVSVLAGDDVLGPSCPFHSGGAGWRMWYSLPTAMWWAICIFTLLAASCYWLLILQMLLPADLHHLQRALCLTAASGTRWKNLGPLKPASGVELTVAPDLATALVKQTEFTEAEWRAFGVTRLKTHHFVKSGANYYGASSWASPRLGARYLLRLLHRTRDYTLTFVLHTPLILLSFFVVPQWVQSRILFQPTPVFFTRGPKGTCIASSVCCATGVLIAAIAVYNLIQLLGVVPVATLDPFQCS